MEHWRWLLGSAAVAAACIALLAGVRNGDLDAVAGVVLTGALLIFARTLIRLASEAPARRQQRNGGPPSRG
jgi:hypothetical protein